MEPMESPNFLEHAELLDENTPHYLNAFHKYLIQHNMSPNTITAYIYSVRHFLHTLDSLIPIMSAYTKYTS